MPILRHPDLPADQTIDVDDDRVALHAKSGWVPVDPTDDDDLTTGVAASKSPKPGARR